MIRRWHSVGSPLLAGSVATGLAVLVVWMRWRGSDLPAHFFRIGLVERDGITAWNNHWFGGHHTLGYGVLFPVLGATFGLWQVAVASAGVSSILADRVIATGLGRRHLPASLWFAAGTATNVAIGRLPFALGMTLGLAAVLAVQHRRVAVAVVLTVAVAAASPVVSAFLAIVYAGWGWSSDRRERRLFGALIVAAVAPVLAIAAMYPQGGMFPFRFGALVWTLAISAGVLIAVPERERMVRASVVCYMLAAVATFLVPTPLGANISRFGMYAAGPVVLALVPWRRAVVAGVLLPAIWFWQWSPSFDAITRARDDPSIERGYHRPLLRFLASAGAETSRIEVVPTGRHWETAYVAARFPIARGWERQLDIKFNPLFYDDPLDAEEYHDWLLDLGVRYVALADVTLDDSGIREAELIDGGLDFLRPVWEGRHWRVFAVTDSPGVIDGPARLVDVDSDEYTLDVRAAGDVVLRVRSSAFWTSDPEACIEPTEDGWIVLRDLQPGRVVVSLDGGELVGTDPCDEESRPQPADRSSSSTTIS